MILLVVASWLTAACGESPHPKSVSFGEEPVEPATTAPVTAPVTESPPTAAPPPPPVPAAPPQLAGESTAPGIAPLTKAEQNEMNDKCDPFLAKLRRQVQGESGRVARTEKLLELIEGDGDVDARCRDLMKRGLRGYLAATHEGGATMILKQMLVGLSSHLAKTSKLCESASPADAGWACLRTPVSKRDRFEYQLETDGDTYEVRATGSPVEGAGVTVLFITGEVKDGDIDLGAPVMRRSP